MFETLSSEDPYIVFRFVGSWKCVLTSPKRVYAIVRLEPYLLTKNFINRFTLLMKWRSALN